MKTKKISKIAFACDHRGFELKEPIFQFLKSKSFQVTDCGTFSDKAADYPDFILEAAEKVSSGVCDRAVGVCYTGIGSAIAANKVPGVRAALVRSVKEAELSRAHNDANMLILGSGFVPREELVNILETWFATPFEGGRHERRVGKINDYEKRRCP